MSRILFVLLCGFVLEAQAIVMTPGQPEQQAEKQTVTSKPVAPATRARPVVKPSKAPVPKQAPLPVLSKASVGFCQAATAYPQNPNYDMMDLYLQQGADINAACRDSRMTALYFSLYSGGTNYQLADWLIQHGADINISADFYFSQGMTLAMNAASNSADLKYLEYLIQHGANFHAVDSMGQTALHWFTGWHSVGYPNNTSHGDISGRAVAFIDRLIGQGIDINLQDKRGATALMEAVVYKNVLSCAPEAVKLLLSYGANPSLKNKLGKSALDLAIERATQAGQGQGSCNEVVKILSNPQSVPSRTPSAQNATPNLNVGSKASDSQAQGEANFAGTYSGTYIGSDSGSFQVDIAQDGTAKLSGRSSKMGVSFTGDGKVSRDGSVALGSASTGSTFTGSVNSTGLLSGTWKNTAYNQAGSFQGSKGAANTAATNPLEVINGGLQLLNNILKPR